MRGLRTTTAVLALMAAVPALAQDSDDTPPADPPAVPPDEIVTGDMPPPMPTDMPITDEQLDAALPPSERTAAASGAQVYTPEDFARFAPRSALDMLNQVPGFDIVTGDQGRGLGQASDNVIINGER